VHQVDLAAAAEFPQGRFAQGRTVPLADKSLDRQAAADLDFFAYVVKPFDLNELRASIRDALTAPQLHAAAVAAATFD